MSTRRIVFLAATALLFLSSVSAQSIQVEGLEFEEVRPDFGESRINFSTSYMNQSLTPTQVFVPDELHPRVGQSQYQLTTWDGYNSDGEIVSEEAVLNVGFQFENPGWNETYTWEDSVYPTRDVARLIGNCGGEYYGGCQNSSYPQTYFDSYQESTASINTSDEARVFDFKFNDGGDSYNVTWDIQVSSHYEHLIVNYDLIYNETGQPARVVHEFQDVYSGEETERLTVGAEFERNGSSASKTVTYDNLYEPDESELLYTLVPEKGEISGIEWNGLNHSNSSAGYEMAKSELQDAGISNGSILDRTGGYKLKVWNVSFPADSNKSLEINYIYSPDAVVENGSSFRVRPPREIYTYIVGSGSVIQTQNYSSTGTYTYDIPADAQALNITIAGGMGGDGAEGEDTAEYGQGGGGAVADVLLYVDDSQNIEVGVGAGGKKGTAYIAGGGGGGGGSSAIKYTNGTKLLCAGGGGGGGGSSGDAGYDEAGGDGGSGGYGNGTDGQDGDYASDGYGGFGGSGGRGFYASWCFAGGSGGPGGGTENFPSSSTKGYDGSDGSMQYNVSSSQYDIYSTSVNQDAYEAADVDDGKDGYVYMEAVNLNSAPDSPSVNNPLNGASGIDNSVQLEVQVTDPDGDNMNVSFHWGNGTEIITNTGVSNGSSTSTTVSGLEWGTSYNWYVNVSDGSTSTKSNTSNFTTQYAPQISGTRFVDNRSSGLRELRLDLDDQEESDISTFSGLPDSSVFTNTSLETQVELPFRSIVSISDFYNASDEVEVDVWESDSGLREMGYSHSLDTQRVNQTVTVFNNASSPMDYRLTLDLPGTVLQDQSWNGTISGSSNVTQTGVSEGDWIINESESTTEIGQNTSIEAGIDQQTLFNQTQLTVNNTRGFGFSSVDISSRCSTTSTVDVPSGESVVTDACNNKSFSGDWIQNEANTSVSYKQGSVILGKDITTEYTATQNVEATNVRTDTDLEVNLDTLLSDISGCSLDNSSTQSLPADQVSQFKFERSCTPGQHLNRTPVVKTETSDFYKYSIEFGFEILSNLTEEETTEYAVKSSWADNWNNRDPTETEAVVDSNGKDISINERVINDTEYIIFVIGDDHTNSSIHEGPHTATLTYFEDKTPGSTSGGGSSGGSGGGLPLTGGPSETPVENVTSDLYNWSVSAITSEDAKTFQISGYPGATFEKYVVVRNTGESNVTLDIECVSLGNECSWVDLSVDRVVLNRNSFSEKTIKVNGTVPAGFDPEDAPAQFSVRVADPEFSGSQSGPHVGYVDFTVTHSPLSGKLLDLLFKSVDGRELRSPVPWGHSIGYWFIAIPIFWSVVLAIVWTFVEWLVPLSKQSRWWSKNLKPIGTLLIFFLAYVLVP